MNFKKKYLKYNCKCKQILNIMYGGDITNDAEIQEKVKIIATDTLNLTHNQQCNVVGYTDATYFTGFYKLAKFEVAGDKDYWPIIIYYKISQNESGVGNIIYPFDTTIFSKMLLSSDTEEKIINTSQLSIDKFYIDTKYTNYEDEGEVITKSDKLWKLTDIKDYWVFSDEHIPIDDPDYTIKIVADNTDMFQQVEQYNPSIVSSDVDLKKIIEDNTTITNNLSSQQIEKIREMDNKELMSLQSSIRIGNLTSRYISNGKLKQQNHDFYSEKINTFYKYCKLLPQSNDDFYTFRSVRKSVSFDIQKEFNTGVKLNMTLPFSTSMSFEFVLGWQLLTDMLIYIIRVPKEETYMVLDKSSQFEITLSPGILTYNKRLLHTRNDHIIPIIMCNFKSYSKTDAYLNLKQILD